MATRSLSEKELRVLVVHVSNTAHTSVLHVVEFGGLDAIRQYFSSPVLPAIQYYTVITLWNYAVPTLVNSYMYCSCDYWQCDMCIIRFMYSLNCLSTLPNVYSTCSHVII